MAELLILGSGTGLPNPKRAAPGYLLFTGKKKILIDSGAGTLQRLILHGVTYQDIDCILYSHLHPDHTMDIASILFSARNPLDPRKKDLVIIGPKGLKGFYDKWLSLYGDAITPESYKIIFKEIDDGRINLGACGVIVKRVEHTPNSIGLRIELQNGVSLAYSGDTGYCKNIVSLARGVELLVLECSFPEASKTEKGHLWPSLAGKIASEANCKRLILTHFYPICDRYPILKECKAHFKGQIILAKDSMRLMMQPGVP